VGDLKPGWSRVRFGEVVRLGKESCKDPRAEGIERYIALEHMTPDDLKIRSWGDVSDGTTFTRRCRPGQVLFGKRRAYQRKVAVCDFDALCSGDIYVFESKDPTRLLPELLPFICQTEAFFEFAVGTSAGSLSPRTNWKSLVNYEFDLPPLDEQGQVARLLKAMLASLDTLMDVERSAQSLRLSQLSNVFGRDLNSVGPVSWLRDREVDMANGSPRWVPLQDVIDTIIDYRGKTPPYDDAGTIAVVSQEDVQVGRLEPTSKWVTEETAAKWTHRGEPEPGDVVFRMERFPGEVARLPATRVILTRGVFAIRPDTSKISKQYLYWYLYWLKRGGFWRIHAHATTVPRLYKHEVLATPLRVLPLDEQEALCASLAQVEAAGHAAVERAMALRDAYRVSLAEALEAPQ
jgi:type I restriction enzyme S subunit